MKKLINLPKKFCLYSNYRKLMSHFFPSVVRGMKQISDSNYLVLLNITTFLNSGHKNDLFLLIKSSVLEYKAILPMLFVDRLYC